MSEQEKNAALAEIEVARNQPPTLKEVAELLASKLEPLMEYTDYTEPNVSILSAVKIGKWHSVEEDWQCEMNFEYGNYQRKFKPIYAFAPTLAQLIAKMEQEIAQFINDMAKTPATHEQQ